MGASPACKARFCPNEAQPKSTSKLTSVKPDSDVYLHPLGMKLAVANDTQGFRRLKRHLEGHEVALVVMEATGKLHRAAHRSLTESGLAVAVVNPLRSRLFAEASGALARPTASTPGCWPSSARVRAQARSSLQANSCKPCRICCVAGIRPSPPAPPSSTSSAKQSSPSVFKFLRPKQPPGLA